MIDCHHVREGERDRDGKTPTPEPSVTLVLVCGVGQQELLALQGLNPKRFCLPADGRGYCLANRLAGSAGASVFVCCM